MNGWIHREILHTIARFLPLNPHAGVAGFISQELSLLMMTWRHLWNYLERFQQDLWGWYPRITFKLKFNVFSLQLITGEWARVRFKVWPSPRSDAELRILWELAERPAHSILHYCRLWVRGSDWECTLKLSNLLKRAKFIWIIPLLLGPTLNTNLLSKQKEINIDNRITPSSLSQKSHFPAVLLYYLSSS